MKGWAFTRHSNGWSKIKLSYKVLRYRSQDRTSVPKEREREREREEKKRRVVHLFTFACASGGEVWQDQVACVFLLFCRCVRSLLRSPKGCKDERDAECVVGSSKAPAITAPSARDFRPLWRDREEAQKEANKCRRKPTRCVVEAYPKSTTRTLIISVSDRGQSRRCLQRVWRFPVMFASSAATCQHRFFHKRSSPVSECSGE